VEAIFTSQAGFVRLC